LGGAVVRDLRYWVERALEGGLVGTVNDIRNNATGASSASLNEVEARVSRTTGRSSYPPGAGAT